ncbi:hypothetical protein BpHYR1_020695 [Brachionus plicatilis]|uniref:Uncharacterized protein n=1 Tax=Brachionus plicatilis TaxID=10195 RepID=A0A3M7T4Z7_BRAPC|nr:hypothetical protein BpHYR1_020695 [Brachionus plicatilis]
MLEGLKNANEDYNNGQYEKALKLYLDMNQHIERMLPEDYVAIEIPFITYLLLRALPRKAISL